MDLDGIMRRYHEGREFEHDLGGRSEGKNAFQCICCVASLVGLKLKVYGQIDRCCGREA